MTDRKYYVGVSYMGVDFTYDSQCWKAFAFSSKAGRDKWLGENEYENGKLVAEAISRKNAIRIAKGVKKTWAYRICLDHNSRLCNADYPAEHGMNCDYCTDCVGEVVDSWEKNFEVL